MVEVLKNPKVLFKKNNLMDQFKIFHGSFFKKSLKHLTNQDKNDFIKFLEGYELNPYNMFICKNTKILNQFYNEIFTWLFKCEDEFKDKDLSGYDKKEFTGFWLKDSCLIGLEKI